jgi:hypothetical protein
VVMVRHQPFLSGLLFQTASAAFNTAKLHSSIPISTAKNSGRAVICFDPGCCVLTSKGGSHESLQV